MKQETKDKLKKWLPISAILLLMIAMLVFLTVPSTVFYGEDDPKSNNEDVVYEDRCSSHEHVAYAVCDLELSAMNTEEGNDTSLPYTPNYFDYCKTVGENQLEVGGQDVFAGPNNSVMERTFSCTVDVEASKIVKHDLAIIKVR